MEVDQDRKYLKKREKNRSESGEPLSTDHKVSGNVKSNKSNMRGRTLIKKLLIIKCLKRSSMLDFVVIY